MAYCTQTNVSLDSSLYTIPRLNSPYSSLFTTYSTQTTLPTILLRCCTALKLSQQQPVYYTILYDTQTPPTAPCLHATSSSVGNEESSATFPLLRIIIIAQDPLLRIIAIAQDPVGKIATTAVLIVLLICDSSADEH